MSDATTAALLVFVILAGVTGIAVWASQRIERSVTAIGDRYETLFRELKDEILDDVKAENRRHLSATRALVVEHSELEALVDLIRSHAPPGTPLPRDPGEMFKPLS